MAIDLHSSNCAHSFNETFENPHHPEHDGPKGDNGLPTGPGLTFRCLPACVYAIHYSGKHNLKWEGPTIDELAEIIPSILPPHLRFLILRIKGKRRAYVTDIETAEKLRAIQRRIDSKQFVPRTTTAQEEEYRAWKEGQWEQMREIMHA